jgi:hypothetical protein
VFLRRPNPTQTFFKEIPMNHFIRLLTLSRLERIGYGTALIILLLFFTLEQLLAIGLAAYVFNQVIELVAEILKPVAAKVAA